MWSKVVIVNACYKPKCVCLLCSSKDPYAQVAYKSNHTLCSSKEIVSRVNYSGICILRIYYYVDADYVGACCRRRRVDLLLSYQTFAWRNLMLYWILLQRKCIQPCSSGSSNLFPAETPSTTPTPCLYFGHGCHFVAQTHAVVSACCKSLK